jgi:hypothetical protein
MPDKSPSHASVHRKEHFSHLLSGAHTFIFNVEVKQFDHPQQLNAIELFLNRVIISVGLDLGMH